MALINNPQQILPHLTYNLSEALELVQVITMEYESNGMDSLANIDYGAALNTVLAKINNQMKMLDDSGVFTAGWQSEE